MPVRDPSRRLLCARYPHLALIAVWRRFPELRGEPVVIGEGAELRLPVIAASEAARAAGVEPGDTLRQARQRCPQAAMVDLDGDALAGFRRRLVESLGELSPAVEIGDDELLCDLSGRHAVLGDEISWATAVGRRLVELLDGELPALGVAGNRLVARLAAGCSEPRRVRRIPPGGEAAFLAPLPLDLFPVSPAVASRLAVMGLDCAGAVANLSPADLQRQFGQEGMVLAAAVRGEDAAGITPLPPARCLSERLVFEGGVTDLGVLGAAGRRLAEGQGRRLAEAGLTAGSVRLRLEIDGGEECSEELTPGAPAGGVDELWAVVMLLLSRARPAGPVQAISLEVAGLGSGPGRQADLWRSGDARREAVLVTAMRLEARFAGARVRRPQLVTDPGDLPERRFSWALAGRT